MKRGIVMVWLLILAGCIVVLFWRNEWKYSLPTPVPATYKAVAFGSDIALPASIDRKQAPARRPLFLHFFNPDCPCSRFNMPHFRSIVTEYGSETDFAIVLMTGKHYTDEEVRNRYDLPATVRVFRDSSLAARCGVYSTPQAVIIDNQDRLFYRGNYNRARYCNDEKTSFAKIALEGYLKNNLVQNFSPLALKAYGCQLPTCTQ
jgi:hypothetical protein